MASPDIPGTPAPEPPPRPTVFISYATEDRPAAQALRDALPAHGLDVWYDESGLIGGEAWDRKIRDQIRQCDFFMPVVSAHTEARLEGYFRREWRLAVERNLDMADDHIFLVPVVIDDTSQEGARVPERFVQVQWARIPGGRPNAALEALCKRMLAGDPAPAPRERRAHHPSHPPPGSMPPRAPTGRGARPPPPDFPAFPREEPGQRTRFWFQVAGWGLQAGWLLFQRFPRWVRVVAYCWLFVVMVEWMGSSHRHHDTVSYADLQKLGQIAQAYQGTDPADIKNLATQISSQLTADTKIGGQAPLLVLPFTAPLSDPDALKVASTAFALLYGRLVLTRHGGVALLPAQIPSLDSSTATALGHKHHSRYVLYGGVDQGSSPPRLTVNMLEVEDSAVVWSGSYPLAGADPAAIATAVSSSVQHRADEDDDDDN